MSEDRVNNKIEVRSEEVQEILGQIPNRLIRWGITVIFITVLVLFISSWFFKYPDIITSSIIVTTENPPVSIIGRTNGKIEELFINDSQKVEEGELLAVVENTAYYKDVLELKEALLKYDNATLFLSDSIFTFKENYVLGEIQPVYSSLVRLYLDYKNFLELNYHNKKAEAIKAQMEKVKLFYHRQYNQSIILEKEVKIGKLQYNRDSALHQSKVISDSDFEKTESAFLQKIYSFEGAKIVLSNSQVQLSQLEQTILDLQLQYLESKNKSESIFKESFDNLSSHIDLWEQKYLLKSPIGGNITFTKYWSKNQNIKAGDIVFTIVTDKPSQIIGKVNLPIQGAGKVKLGQNVNIKFDSYPYMEYGMVKGLVKSISLVPTDNNYSLEVVLTNGLISTYGKDLQFNQEMLGVAEIITDDLRLLERIINPIKSTFKDKINFEN